jgi:hypothetical protein
MVTGTHSVMRNPNQSRLPDNKELIQRLTDATENLQKNPYWT